MNETTKRNELDLLTPRELEVLKLVVEGKSSQQIARLLGVAPATIDTYRYRIMVKLQIWDLPSLVRFAVRYGLVEP